MSEADKKKYRREIWLQWKMIVARKKLSSFEYKLIDGYFERGIAIEVIIQAIGAAVARARRKSVPVYSLGFINADIERILHDRARMNIGSSSDSEAWREAAHNSLTEMADESTDPERAAMLRELVAAIPTLSRSQVEERYRAIANISSLCPKP